MAKEKPKYFQFILGTVLVLVSIILIFAYVNEPKVSPLPALQEEREQSEQSIQNMNYLSAQEWSYYDNAMEDIQVLGEGQVIQFGIVKDPTEDTIAYFASTTAPDEQNEVLLSIYKYNEDDYSFDRLWRARVFKGDQFGIRGSEEDTPALHAVGYDNGELILFVKYKSDSPGPCTSPYLLGAQDENDFRNLISMDLSDPYGGFADYEPSADVLQEKQEEEQACQENLR